MTILKDKFCKSLLLLKDKPLWGMSAGNKKGCNLHFRFGAELPEEKQIFLINVPDAYPREYQGEYDLFIKCTWRLDSQEKVLCSNKSYFRTVCRGLNKIKGKVVRDIELHFPGYDLTLYFDKGLTFKIFCDAVNLKYGGDNYYYSVLPEDNFEIGTLSRLKLSKLSV